MNVNGFLNLLEEVAPLNLSKEFCEKYGAYDNSGIIVSVDEEITGVVFALDLTDAVINTAIQKGYNLIVTHHPAIYKGITEIPTSSVIYKAIKNNIGVISMHLNSDGAKYGVDYYLAKGLGAKNEEILMPLTGGGYGRTFTLNKKLCNVVEDYKKEFNSNKVFVYGNLNDNIQTVSSFCGGGFDYYEYSLSEKSQLIVSSDIPHHLILKVVESGRAVMQITHYASEIYGFKKMYEGVNFANKIFVTEEIYL